MKKVIILLGLLVAATVMAQDRTTVTVKSGEVSNGVIILTVRQASVGQQGKKTTFVLQCNKGQSGCVIPPPGDYLMVRLPENWGMYACTDVDLYPPSADPQTSEKIGEYCLIDK